MILSTDCFSIMHNTEISNVLMLSYGVLEAVLMAYFKRKLKQI